MEKSHGNANSNPWRCKFKQEEAASKATVQNRSRNCPSERQSGTGPHRPYHSKRLGHFPTLHLMPSTFTRRASKYPSEPYLSPENSGVRAQTSAILCRETASIRENCTAILGADRKWDVEKYAK